MSSGAISLKNVGFVYSIEITDLSDGIYWRPLVTNVGGMSWSIAICTGFSNGESAIYLYLKCSPCIESKEWSWCCDVESTIILNSTKPNQSAYVKSHPNTTLNNDSNIVGGTFITWTDLLPYLRGHLIILDIQLSTSPIRMYRPAQVFGRQSTIRFGVDNMSQLETKFGPKLIVGGNKWTVYVTKSGDYLGIFLRDIRNPMNRNWTWFAKCSFKLLTWEPFSKSYTLDVEHRYYYNGEDWGYPYFMPWYNLMWPENKFLHNDKAIFEVTLEVEPAEPFWRMQRKAIRSEEEESFECPICYESVVGRKPVATACGHIFCSTCIKQSIEERKKCPICNLDADLFDLRPIYW